MECALEHDDALSLRIEPRELHGVLDSLGAGVEERGARLAADRSEGAEPLGELDVALVRHDGEVRVEEPVDLLGDRLDDARIVVTDVRDADAPDEVDERVPIDVGDRGPARAIGDDRLVDDERSGDCVPLAVEDLAAARAGISVRISITRVAATRGSLSVRPVGEASCRAMADHDLGDDPIAQLRAWLDEAQRRHGRPQAMTLATATPDGKPSVRVVLLRGLDHHGLTFFTNRTSRKGEELRLNPRAAVAIHWWELGPASAGRGRRRRACGRRVDRVLGDPATRESDRRLGITPVTDSRTSRRAR